MASKGHSFIVASISRKIRELGYDITYVDGESSDITRIKPKIPPKLINHKPDIIGENNLGNFCIGEAKTLNDLKSKRSRQQFVDFYEFISLFEGNYLIIGIPSSALFELNKLLAKLNISGSSLIILQIPDILLK